MKGFAGCCYEQLGQRNLGRRLLALDAQELGVLLQALPQAQENSGDFLAW